MTLTFTTPQVIWIAAIALIAVAALVFFGLVLVRALSEIGTAGRKRRRRQDVRDLMAIISDNEDMTPDSIDLPGRRLRRLETAAMSLLDELRGPERAGIIRFLLAVGTLTRAINQMQSRHAFVRERYAAMLGLFAEERAEAQLRIALNDRDMAVRLSAASALLGMDGNIDLEEVMASLDRDGALTNARSLLFGEKSVSLEQAEGDHALEARLKLFGLEIFGGTAGRIAADTLVREIRGDDPVVQATALRAVQGDDHPALKEAIVEKLEHEDWRVQVEAAAASGRLDLEEAVGTLRGLRDKSDWQVRNAAAQALRRIGQNQGVEGQT